MRPIPDAEAQGETVAPAPTIGIGPAKVDDVALMQSARSTGRPATKRIDVADPLLVTDPVVPVAVPTPGPTTPDRAADAVQVAAFMPLDAQLPVAASIAPSADAAPTPATTAIANAPQPEPEAPRADAPFAKSTAPAAIPQPGAPLPATALDTAAQLVTRPGSTPRATAAATTRVATVAEPQVPTLTTAAALAATAAAAAPTQPAPLDMTHHTWPAAMIARIERMRDELDAVSTAIRLIPDALGKIDVSLTQGDGVTHVHLAAEQPQTRTLLAEAAPKLAELAEQRGLKLGDAQVHSGLGSNGGGQQASAQQTPRRPATASTPAAQKRADPTPEDRIA